MNCPKCNAEIPAGKNFCVECGESIGAKLFLLVVAVIVIWGLMVCGGIALMICFPVWWGFLSGGIISGWGIAALVRPVRDLVKHLP